MVGPHRPDGPLRIVIGADTFPPDVNGAAHFAGRLASGLAGRGHEVHVVCPATGPAPSEAGEPVCTDVMVHRLPSYPVLVHPSFRICRPWVLSRRAGDALDAVRPDVVHVQSHFLVGRALLAAARRRGLPVVATNHFMPENLLGYLKITTTQRAAVTWLAWRDLCRVYGRAHAVTAPTPRAAALLMAQGLRRRVQAISCGIDTARYQASVPMPAIEAMILFVGRLDEEKHVDELVRALTLIPAELGARLEVVGAGSQRASLDALTDRLGLRNRVHFHGLAPERVLLDAYARCAVFCMPGTAELQSLATMEAMAAGKPVVAAHAMALPHLVRQGQNGRLYPPGDVPALAEALAAILRLPPAGREALGATGRRIVAGHELAGTLDAFQTVYRQVCRTVPARPSRVGAARGPR